MGTGVFVGTLVGVGTIGIRVGVNVGKGVSVGVGVDVGVGTVAVRVAIGVGVTVVVFLGVGVADGTGVLVTGIETVGSGVVGTAINLGINTNTAKGITCPLLPVADIFSR